VTARPRVRIAPSPTGDPHVGTAYVALFNRTWARQQGGSFILRIDDTDRTRYRADSEAAIFRALRWLGFDWDEGPDVGGPHAPYRQSERLDIYRERVEELLAHGSAYRCFCTAERLAALRTEQEARKDRLGYDGHCRDLAPGDAVRRAEAGEPFVVRLRVPSGGSTVFRDELRGEISVSNDEIDDQVLVKSDGFPTYHLANVVDDIAFGITEVVRAEEWLISTPKHLLLHRAFGAPLPRWFHVPLLRNRDHSKISKRKNPVSLDWYRAQGYIPEALLNFLALMGWATKDGEEVFDLARFEREFRLEDISLGAPVFDLDKLEWLNGQHLRRLGAAELHRRLAEERLLPAGADEAGLERILPVVVERLHRLTDVPDKTRWYFGEPDEPAIADLAPPKKGIADAIPVLRETRAALAALAGFDGPTIERTLEEVRARLGIPKPQLFMPLRVALTGRTDSPGIHEVLGALGPERATARLAAALARVEAAAGGTSGSS